MSAQEPRAEYEARLASRSASHALLGRRDRVVSGLRLLVFGLLVACGIAAWTFDWLSYGWLALPAALFVGLVLYHERVIRGRELARRAVAYYTRALARLDGEWQGRGSQRTDFVSDDHPYAADLDLFGHGSVFDLLSTASTAEGEETLAGWLASPAPIDEIRARHPAVDELRLMLDLREELALVGADVPDSASGSLTSWASSPRVIGPSVRVLAWALALAGLGSLAAWILTPVGPLPLVVCLVASIVVHQLLARRIKRVVASLERPGRELRVLAGVLERLEGESFTAPRLRELRDMLTAEGRRASRAIRKLESLQSRLDARRNAFFAPLAYLVMWTVHVVCDIEAWRASAGSRIPAWLSAVGEIEALSSLACYAYEHPADPFPALEPEGPLLEADGLGHPLIAEAECVRNSVHLSAEVPAWVVSGSNMSGKSTLLRTLGVNAVLAQAGAPVRAVSLRLGPCAIGATIRIQDSLHGRTSRFYTEIKRLKQIRDLADGDRPLLYLLDEIFHGTNSHDRQVGAAALLREFIGAGAMGLMVTHDLAIAEAAEGFEGRVRNVHFVDRLEGGKLSFDYTLRDGIVQRSNAIELMRAVGLDV
ncbi:MAG: DNA mismatch repair protein MutS [Deltaproteobacteria bacterium]|nr:DNA mismatch repair protein MutS [Deltaproteobacteria bacterium]